MCTHAAFTATFQRSSPREQPWSSSHHHRVGVGSIVPKMGNIFSNKGQDLEDAVREGNMDKVQDLIRHGAPLSWKNYYGWTALHWASYNAHVEIIQLLLDKGAELNELNNDNKLPIDICGYNCRDKQRILQALSVLQEAASRQQLQSMQTSR